MSTTTSQPGALNAASSPMYPRSNVMTQPPSPYSPQGAYNTMQGAGESVAHNVDKAANEVAGKTKNSGVWNLVVLIIVITLVYMVLFWLLKIPVVLTTNAVGSLTTDVSFWKLLGTSFVAALITVFIIWGVSKLTSKK